jgi:hypothetical protein
LKKLIIQVGITVGEGKILAGPALIGDKSLFFLYLKEKGDWGIPF